MDFWLRTLDSKYWNLDSGFKKAIRLKNCFYSVNCFWNFDDDNEDNNNPDWILQQTFKLFLIFFLSFFVSMFFFVLSLYFFFCSLLLSIIFSLYQTKSLYPLQSNNNPDWLLQQTFKLFYWFIFLSHFVSLLSLFFFVLSLFRFFWLPSSSFILLCDDNNQKFLNPNYGIKYIRIFA